MKLLNLFLKSVGGSNKLKSPGFYQPMDLVPETWSSKDIAEWSIAIEFGSMPCGKLEIFDLPKDFPLHEYQIVPAYILADDGTWQVTNWSLVHRSRVASAELLEKREAETLRQTRSALK